MAAKKQTISRTIPSSVEYLEEIESLSCKVADQCGFKEDDIDDISIALTEMINNAIMHGNKNDPTKKVQIEFKASDGQLDISIFDEGDGFNPDKLNNPLDPENLMAERGRGIYLVRALMDDVDFTITEKGTRVTITKKL